jgi:hypothetical protein
VSLPWSRSVRLRVEPEGLLSSLETGWRPRRRVDASFPSLAARGAEGDSQALGGERLETALQELELAGPMRGARCAVELDDSMVHFDVAEGDFEVQDDRQLRAIAVACFAELLGESAGSYEVRWSLQTGGRHLLIAGVPRSIIAALATIAERQGSRLASIQPAFVRQWNSFDRSLLADTSLFAVLSGAHVVVACVVQGAICGISVGLASIAANAETVEPNVELPRIADLQEVGSTLDTRAVRLLTSLGLEPSEGTQFILVAGDPLAVTASPRWKVVQASGAMP